MKLKSILSAALALTMLVSVQTTALAAEAADSPALRSDVRDRLLSAADDYNLDLSPEDILRGDPDGSLRETDPVTRAEALIMLGRAFGDLPEPVGHNARVAYPAASFTDVPAWAQTELADVFAAGIVAGTSETAFSPQDPVTMEQLELFIDRTYALFGTNEKDDFYAAVNKEWLDSSTIKPGYPSSGTLQDMMADSSAILALIENAAADPKTQDEKRIAALYNNILDWEARDAAGIAPLQPYLDAIDQADSLAALMDVRSQVSAELGVETLVGFGANIDAKDSRYYMVEFTTLSPSLGKTLYSEGTEQQKDAYLTYLTTLLTLGGLEEDAAQAGAQRMWEIESSLAPAMLEQQEYSNIDLTYNTYTMEELKALFPHIDLDQVYADSGFDPADKINVTDVGLMEAAAVYFTEDHLEDLRILMRASLLDSFGSTLSRDFETAANTFQQDFYGIQGTLSDEENAAEVVKVFLSDELGRLYAEEHFSPEAKADVEDMVADFLKVYETRIQNLDWMSDTTKAKAIEKLQAINVMAGYPDEDDWLNMLEGITLTPAEKGGSYFANTVQITLAQKDLYGELLKKPINKDIWPMAVYTVNAGYMPAYNAIIFPAGILQTPMYDVTASREENLGAIGYVIAHEITHAFDNNGAKYDKVGNAADWWTEEDYAAFEALCQEVIAYYDGQEAVPGIPCNGTLTLSENVADLGAISCIVEAAGQGEDADYVTLFRSAAETWASTTSREIAAYYAQVDVHAPDKLRGMLPLQAQDKFYEAFEIHEGDGMWIAPEDRVSIW